MNMKGKDENAWYYAAAAYSDKRRVHPRQQSKLKVDQDMPGLYQLLFLFLGAAWCPGKHKLSKTVFLHSGPGDEHQVPHTDFSGEEKEWEGDEVPLNVLVALEEEGCKLRVWPKTHKRMDADTTRRGGISLEDDYVDIHLECGEAIVFRGDLVHAGYGYSKVNRRLHFYVHMPKTRWGKHYGVHTYPWKRKEWLQKKDKMPKK